MTLHLQLAQLTCLPCVTLFFIYRPSSFTFIELNTPEPNIRECCTMKEKDT